MNCFNHPKLISVGVCQDCQKGLCNECASKYSFPICAQCTSSRLKIEKNLIYKELLITFGVAIFATYILMGFLKLREVIEHEKYLSEGFGKIFLWAFGIYFFASLIVGWKTFKRMNLSYFLTLPLIGWVIYLVFKLIIFGFKLFLSVIIGAFILPFKTYKKIKRLIELNNI